MREYEFDIKVLCKDGIPGSFCFAVDTDSCLEAFQSAIKEAFECDDVVSVCSVSLIKERETLR